ncbi:MAG: ATP-dependent sacrificial sulfur transferase LarE [candidate division Zixibacteria bacterium]|nr:ATP-dependent sacrificial sulfur transferase LarE [candidate division Zixibacteria bacterium]
MSEELSRAAADIDTQLLIDKLLACVRRRSSALVAFSGGLDSALVLWACKQTLGDLRVLAVTSVSPSFPESERAEVENFAAYIGLDSSRLRFILTKEMEVAGYYENSPQRCYFCKSELYGELEKIRSQENIDVIFDGANLSDLGDFRPGARAAAENKVASPLLECGFDKPTVREIARALQLPVADKPASACLSSRIPHGVTITEDVLRQIDRAESALKGLGFSGFRVRYHNEVARLELSAPDMRKLDDDALRHQVARAVKNAGFRFVTLDLEGYRTGSLNPPEALKQEN